MAQESIRNFIHGINNHQIMGGFWLPNIQRNFVWKEEQIERLFDSILRQYPIGTLLVWRTKSQIKRRKFIDNWRKKINLNDFFVPQDDLNKMLVLDGQQRLQSLFIGLKGTYDRKELCINILSGGNDISAEDIKYVFKFVDKDDIKFPFIRIKDIVIPDITNREIRIKILQLNNELNEDQKELIELNVDLIRDVFCTQQNIHYQVVDSIDRPNTFTDDDIVEIFIRANSGGTSLAKKDLLFSLLVNSWEDADTRINDLIDEINTTGGFNFDVDFILKTCLILINTGAKYDIAKFRNENNKNAIILNWEIIAESIKWCKDLIYGNTYIKSDKNLPSYLSLIPIIYTRYNYPRKCDANLNDFKTFLLKVNLTGVYGGVTDSFTDGIINVINKNENFNLSEIFSFIKDEGKSIEITSNKLFDIKYTSKELHLLLNIWYGFNYQPALKENLPNVDHIFPRSELRKELITDIHTNTLRTCTKDEINQLANLMLLTAAENQAGGKGKILPSTWFSDPIRDNDEYRERHLIPSDRELWKIENYYHFIEARKELIKEKFNLYGLIRI
jgi:uncharacterized protein with ParB-like and HNH nuclease domain